MRWHRNPAHDDAANDASRPWWDQAAAATGLPAPDFDAVLGGEASAGAPVEPVTPAADVPAEPAPATGPVRRTVLGGLRGALRPLTAARGVPAVAMPEAAPAPAQPSYADEQDTVLMPAAIPPSFAPQEAADDVDEPYVPHFEVPAAAQAVAPAGYDEHQGTEAPPVRPFVEQELDGGYDDVAPAEAQEPGFTTAPAGEDELEQGYEHDAGTTSAELVPETAERQDVTFDDAAPAAEDAPTGSAGTDGAFAVEGSADVEQLDEPDGFEEPQDAEAFAADAYRAEAEATVVGDLPDDAGTEDAYDGHAVGAGLDELPPTASTEAEPAADAVAAPADPLTSTWTIPVPEEHEDDEEPARLSHPHPDDIAIPQVEMSISFGERIERLVAAAVTEADNTRADAQAEAGQLLQDAKLDAEQRVAAAQRQAAEIVASTQRRCDDELAAAQRTRQESEQVLTDARAEADELRKRVRDEVAELRAEIDEHAQAMLARTHAETGRTLAAARAELEELTARKSELEAQMTSIRALLSDAVVSPLPQEVSGFFTAPTPVVETPEQA